MQDVRKIKNYGKLCSCGCGKVRDRIVKRAGVPEFTPLRTECRREYERQYKQLRNKFDEGTDMPTENLTRSGVAPVYLQQLHGSKLIQAISNMRRAG